MAEAAEVRIVGHNGTLPFPWKTASTVNSAKEGLAFV
jgi:hypothetical protein